MSLTTTTIRNLGSFELVTTKTTPISAPAPKKKKKRYASSTISYESDLDSVMEEEEVSSNTTAGSRGMFPIKETPGRPKTSARKPPTKTNKKSTGRRVSFDSHTQTVAGHFVSGGSRRIHEEHVDSDSSSGNSVYSDASEYFENDLLPPSPPSPISVRSSPVMKPPVSPVTKSTTNMQPLKLSNAQPHQRHFDNFSMSEVAATRSPGPRQHHYHQIADDMDSIDIPTSSAKLTEATLRSHDARFSGISHKDRTSEYVKNQSYDSEETNDDSDAISLNSTSSWQPRSKNKPKMAMSMRSSPSVDAQPQPPKMTVQQSARTSTSSTKKKPTIGQPIPKPKNDYSQHLLKRTPSNSSFEREKKKSSGSAFRMQTLREPRKPEPTQSNPSSLPRLTEEQAIYEEPEPFRSRFQDSDDSDVELEAPSKRTMSLSLRPRGFSIGSKKDQTMSPVVSPRRLFGTTKQEDIVPPTPFSEESSELESKPVVMAPKPKKKLFGRNKEGNRAAAPEISESYGGAEVSRKKRFGGLRKVLGLA